MSFWIGIGTVERILLFSTDIQTPFLHIPPITRIRIIYMYTHTPYNRQSVFNIYWIIEVMFKGSQLQYYLGASASTGVSWKIIILEKKLPPYRRRRSARVAKMYLLLLLLFYTPHQLIERYYYVRRNSCNVCSSSRQDYKHLL